MLRDLLHLSTKASKLTRDDKLVVVALTQSYLPLSDSPPSESEQLAIIRRAHEKGHFGTRSVHAALRADGFMWSGMSKQVRAVLQGCSN